MHDPCVFYKLLQDDVCILSVHVDDEMCIGPPNEIDEIILKLRKHLDVVETANDSYLGLHVERDANGITVDQSGYIERVLHRYKMADCKPVSSLSDVSQSLDDCHDSPSCDKTMYQELLGSLMFLMVGTRADLSHTLTNLARFAHDPKVMHYQALKRVLRYVKGTKHLKLFFPAQKQLVLQGESDASWSVTADGKGFSAYLVKAAGCLISWKSTKQRLVALSSAESELMALVDCVRELVWARNMLSELNINNLVRYPIIVEVDSQAVISMVESLGMSPRCKHFRRKLHFVKDEVDKGNVKLAYKPGKCLTADVLTKGVSGKAMTNVLDKLNLL